MSRGKALLVMSVIIAAILLAIVAILRKGGALSTGDWAEPTATPTPAFSGLSVHAARERAEDEHRLLIVDATATWCPPCRQMEATTWRDARVIDWIAEHAVAIQIDVDKLPDVARTLGIRAMPTVIVSRGAEEADRATGLQSAAELLAWLDRIEAGGESLPDSGLAGEVRYSSVPDKGSANALMRYMVAKGALSSGRLDDALTEVEWLWAHGADQQPAFSAVRRSFLAATMKTLVEAHEPAREAFRGFLDTAQQQIDADRVGMDVWFDWVTLCDILGEPSRLTSWYEQHRDADGSIDSGRYWKCHWIADSVFAQLATEQRFSEAGKVYRSPTLPLERQVALMEMIANMPIDGATGTLLRGAMAITGARARGDASLRDSAARLSAALVAAGRDDAAIEVGRFLLAKLDDGASRKALVTRALEWARPLPEHVRWYAEAAEMGSDVESLEPALVAAAGAPSPAPRDGP